MQAGSPGHFLRREAAAHCSAEEAKVQWLVAGMFMQAALALCQCMWSATPRVGDVAAAEDQHCLVETA